MIKEQALHNFFNRFNVPAYNSATVPEDAALPRITYSVSTADFDRPVSITASVWDRSRSWASVIQIKDQIAAELGRGGTIVDGVMWIKPGTPFAQEMSDVDDSIRRIVLNLEAEYA